MKAGKIHHSWIMMGVTFVVLIVAAGVRATPGVLILPLEHEFGWSKATISSAVAVNILLFGLLGPFAAAVMERFGVRRTVAAALLLLAAGVSLTTQMSAAWHLMLLWGVVVGSGSGMLALVLGAFVANRWFVKNRGLVMGVFAASNATGQLVFLPFLAHLGGLLGWRSMSLTVAGAALAILPIALLLIRERPADVGLTPYGAIDNPAPAGHGESPARRALRGLQDGLRSRDFWLLAGSFFVCGASTSGFIGTHMIPLCADHGIPEVQAAGLLAGMGIIDIFGTMGSGWLSDRFDGRTLLAWYYGLRGLSLMFLPFSFDYSLYGISLFAVFYGLDWAASIPPTVRLAGKAFGENNAALMFGWIAAVHQMGGAFAAWGAGYLRTETGNYLSAFVSAGLLCFVGSIMVLFIGRSGVIPSPATQSAADVPVR